MNSGRRATRQRSLILEEVKRARVHPTADEVFRAVRKKMPRISLGTVYRNLNLLVESAQVRVVRTGGRSMRYDGGGLDHVHMICERCGCITDVPGDGGSGDICSRISASTGYSNVSADLRLTGICPRCIEEDKRDEQNGS